MSIAPTPSLSHPPSPRIARIRSRRGARAAAFEGHFVYPGNTSYAPKSSTRTRKLSTICAGDARGTARRWEQKLESRARRDESLVRACISNSGFYLSHETLGGGR
eukprot:1769621-Rhodomonas_salina.2